MRTLGWAVALITAVAAPVWAEDAPLPPPVVRAPGTGTPAPAVPRVEPVVVQPTSQTFVAPRPSAVQPAPRSVPTGSMFALTGAPRKTVSGARDWHRAANWTTPPPGGSVAAPAAVPATPASPSRVIAQPAAVVRGPSPREVQRQVDTYLQNTGDEGAVALVGSAGNAGYERGFTLRGGNFVLRTNLLLQARYEAFDWDDNSPAPGGDRSGFSLPRAALMFSGEAPCDIRYYMELQFGHDGANLAQDNLRGCTGCLNPNLGPDSHPQRFDVLREAWIEWNACDAFNVRAGLVGLPTTRQLMTPAALQQFVDISLASSWTGLGMSGWTDRNRDYGLLFHGVLGCDDEISYMLSVTNGDGGDGIRNVLDVRTSDNLAYGARVNWAFLGAIGYQEGALRQNTCAWTGEIGAWAFYYADRQDKLHATLGDYLRWGVDLAIGYGGWSMTAAYTMTDDSDVGGTNDDESTSWLVQVGHHFVGTAWELAARWSGYDTEGDLTGNGKAEEFGAALNYYLNGHGNKLQLDVSYIDTDNGGFLILDPYPGYPAFLGNGDSGLLIRFQWQLAI